MKRFFLLLFILAAALFCLAPAFSFGAPPNVGQIGMPVWTANGTVTQWVDRVPGQYFRLNGSGALEMAPAGGGGEITDGTFNGLVGSGFKLTDGLMQFEHPSISGPVLSRLVLSDPLSEYEPVDWTLRRQAGTIAFTSDLEFLDAAWITSGTLPNARLSAVPNSALANSAITINGVSVSLGGTRTISASELTTGTLPNARLSAVPNSALANSAITINGTPVSLGGTITVSGGLTIGTTTITGGTSGRILSNTSGVLSEVATTGTGSVVLSASPRLSGTILDTNGANLLGITATASAVNYFGITNAASGGVPIFEALGSGTNVDLRVRQKGTGGSLYLGRATNGITLNDLGNTTVESLHHFYGNPNGVSLIYGGIGGNGISLGSAACICGTTSTSTAGSVSWRLNSPSTGLLALTFADFSIATVGKGLKVAEGTNARMGTATLTAGSVTISNTTVTANSRFICFPQNIGTISRPAALGCTARSVGTSFTITSGDASDTSTFMWIIIEPN